MKKFTLKSVLAIILLSLGIQFVGCDSKTRTVQKTTPVIVAEQINAIPTYREPIVFITGVDNNTSSFYKGAKTYFEDKQFEIITEAYSLEEVVLWLNNNFDERLYTDIHIVSKNNFWKGMSLETTVEGKAITSGSLINELSKGSFPKLKAVITEDTNIVFHSSELSTNKTLIKVFKNILSADVSPNIITSPHYTIFGGQFSPYYLAKPYYGFYPTAKSPGKVDLSKEFAKKYPNEKEVDWYSALNNEDERFVGDAYTTQFNIPVEFKFTYDGEEEVPYFENAKEIITWISENEELSNKMKVYNIPLNKFRWNSKTTKDKLIIKGITTALCVLKPIIKPYGNLEHMAPEIDNLRLYVVD